MGELVRLRTICAPGGRGRPARGRCSCRSSRLFVNVGALDYRERHLRITAIDQRALRLVCPRTGERWTQLPVGRTLVLYRETAT